MKFQVRTAALLAVMAASVSLSGCLVEKDDTPKKTYQRTTDNLRVYQNGDYINYNVQIITTLADGETLVARSGTLKIEWGSNADLINPFSSTPYNVLKEVTTLTENGTETRWVRYIQQDPATGTVNLVAIEDVNELVWLNTDGALTAVTPMTIFNSPLIATTYTIGDLYLMEGCTPTPCDHPVGLFNDLIEVPGTTKSITTNIGIFTDPLEIKFSGTMTHILGSSPAPGIDFRYACSDGNNFATHSTQAYVFPEIGIIQMTNTCTETPGGKVFYSVTLSDTNIPLPQ